MHVATSNACSCTCTVYCNQCTSCMWLSQQLVGEACNMICAGGAVGCLVSSYRLEFSSQMCCLPPGMSIAWDIWSSATRLCGSHKSPFLPCHVHVTNVFVCNARDIVCGCFHSLCLLIHVRVYIQHTLSMLQVHA